MDPWASRDQDVDWDQYFESIVSVCPWSKAYWLAKRIDIVKWQDESSVVPLGELAARMWIYQGSYGTTLDAIAGRMNEKYPKEEWLYSHGKHGTPVSVLIQQDRRLLTEARSKNKKQTASK
jgi:hypothetical protein